ncbi:MAG: dTMP kinase [Alphaproteobacteria bacterium]|nr:dTMP kinase [Alphaproteobacteria bacterium]
MSKGLFITFEGGEGSGKSTQIKLLKEYFEKKGKNVVLTREPGGSEGAEEIRHILLKGGTDRWDKKTEILLFLAARRDHLTKKVWPALEKGDVVLSDRFHDSTVAYQCFGYGYDAKIETDILALYQFISDGFKPDLTIVLDIAPEKGIQRSKARLGNDEQRFEQMDLSFHQNIRQAFLTLARNEPERFIVINADQSIEQIHQELIIKLEERLNANSARAN